MDLQATVLYYRVGDAAEPVITTTAAGSAYRTAAIAHLNVGPAASIRTVNI